MVDLRSHLPAPHSPARRAESAPPRLFRVELPIDVPLSIGLSEVMLTEYDRAIEILRAEEDRFVAVHETRKSLKRIRSLLRLVRDEIGYDVYRNENVVLRDAARLLSEARTAHVMAEMAPEVVTLSGVPSAYPAVRQLFLDLESRRSALYEPLQVGRQAVVDALTPIQWSRARAERWPVIDVAGDHVRHPIRDEFASMAKGLRRVYRRGGHAMVRAYRTPSVAAFHEWRKRVRYLRHHVEALHQAWPDTMRGLASAVTVLGEILGDEHDHAELGALIESSPAMVAQADARRDLLAWIARHRYELRRRALELGGRIYHETPDAFVARIGRYWAIARGETARS